MDSFSVAAVSYVVVVVHSLFVLLLYNRSLVSDDTKTAIIPCHPVRSPLNLEEMPIFLVTPGLSPVSSGYFCGKLAAWICHQKTG